MWQVWSCVAAQMLHTWFAIKLTKLQSKTVVALWMIHFCCERNWCIWYKLNEKIKTLSDQRLLHNENWTRYILKTLRQLGNWTNIPNLSSGHLVTPTELCNWLSANLNLVGKKWKSGKAPHFSCYWLYCYQPTWNVLEDRAMRVMFSMWTSFLSQFSELHFISLRREKTMQTGSEGSPTPSTRTLLKRSYIHTQSYNQVT